MAFGKKRVKDPSQKLGFFRLLALKSSDVASAACFVIVNGYLSMFCTNYLGMDPDAVSTILLLSNVVDAITNLIACYVVDNSKVTKWGMSDSGLYPEMCHPDTDGCYEYRTYG